MELEGAFQIGLIRGLRRWILHVKSFNLIYYTSSGSLRFERTNGLKSSDEFWNFRVLGHSTARLRIEREGASGKKKKLATSSSSPTLISDLRQLLLRHHLQVTDPFDFENPNPISCSCLLRERNPNSTPPHAIPRNINLMASSSVIRMYPRRLYEVGRTPIQNRI
ncbi:Uncharacterized protein Rs2_29939 [Raphanus sativus]|nr:Uncharacterized protein Rs2_29939 [Raphanus sativus]